MYTFLIVLVSLYLVIALIMFGVFLAGVLMASVFYDNDPMYKTVLRVAGWALLWPYVIASELWIKD